MAAPRETPIDLHCGSVRLDARLSVPPAATLGCVVCHPHPLYGGHMQNPVVVAVCAALGQAGIATLRFDFRGTGRSRGVHSGGPGELEDAGAALDALAAVPGLQAVAMAGYSFGAAIAMRAGAHRPGLVAIAAIAPPLAMLGLDSPVPPAVPLFVVAGTRDDYCPRPDLARLIEARPQTRCEILDGADHFLAGRERDVAAAVAAFLGDLPAAAPGS